ncbi:MAG: hypothetical protein ACQERN_12580 [Thermodesulfobacteriota bacterium]
MEELNEFVEQWTENSAQTKKAFLALKSQLENKPDVKLDFVARQGLTYSLRAARFGHQSPLFVMIDVIEDEPRWLSVCFYGEMISDPAEAGDLIPGGLLGEDGHCFDIEAYADDQMAYLEKRIEEAYARAG